MDFTNKFMAIYWGWFGIEFLSLVFSMEKTTPELVYFGVSRFQSSDAIYHIQYGNLQSTLQHGKTGS